MPITLTCSCGKSLRIADQHAGKPVKCPVCSAIQTAPAAAPAAASAETFTDFDVVEDTTPTPAPLPPEPVAKPVAPVAPAAPARPRLKAAVVADDPPPPAPADPPAKPKKKKKKKRAAAVTEEEEDWYESVRENEARIRRIVRGTAFLVLGVLIVIGVAVAFLIYGEEVKSTGGKTVVGLIVFGIMGVAAIIKGLFGLVFGQFLFEDD